MKHRNDSSAQTVGLAVLRRLRAGDAHVSSVMAQVFREKRIAAGIKADVAERVYGIVRSQRLLDHVIDRSAGSPVVGQSRDLARWLVRAVLDSAITAPMAQGQFPHLDWSRVHDIERELAVMDDHEARLALVESLPDWLASRWISTFGVEEAFAMAHALNRPAPQTIRANTIRVDRDVLAARLRERGLVILPTSRASQGLIVESRTELFRLPEFRLGLFEMQDEGSQLVSELVAPQPSGSVLDACAGTGGKALHLGALLHGRGRIYAVGVGAAGPHRLAELRRRARRAGLHNVRSIATAEQENAPLAKLVGRIDRVLVDAPCSGLGVLRRNPETRWRLQAEDIDRLATLQLSILERFAPYVRPGGRLIYSTCSILPQENDEVIVQFLHDHPEFRGVDAKEILGSTRAHAIGDGKVLRLMPHRHGSDGFYAAVLRRQRN